MSESKMQHVPVIACDLHALTAEEQAEHLSNGTALLNSVQEVRALSDGYALRLPVETQTLYMIARYIAYERRCCAFFRFQVEVEPYETAIWLCLSGGEGVQAFIRAELRDYLPEAVRAGFG